MLTTEMIYGSFRGFVLQTYRAMGLLMAFGAAGYLAVRKLGIIFDKTDQILVAFVFAGALIYAGSTYLVVFLDKRRELTRAKIEGDLRAQRLITLWSIFESTAAGLLGERSDRPVNARALMYGLMDDGFLSAGQIEDLEQALEIRNMVAHGMADSLPNSRIEDASANLEKIASALIRNRAKRERKAS
jgi:hypothetical protein